MNRSPREELLGRRFLTGAEVMKLLRYNNTAAFYAFVRQSGMPFIMLNQRRFLFDAQAVTDWLQDRSIGMDPH